jgi:hypothetical protein
MKIILRTIAVASLTASLAACALFGQVGIGPGGRDAARTVLTVYELAQEGVLIYGNLPLCNPQTPAVKVCRNAALWKKIQVAEDAATGAIMAAQPVLRGDEADIGQLADVALKIKAVTDRMSEANKGLGK